MEENQPQEGRIVIGRVFSIEEFSTLDGPGIRTTVFLKGCPLRCVWCHNPEGLTVENQIIRSHNGCLNCGACLDCGERMTGERKLVRESILVCPRNLIRECAKDYTVQELCERVLKNADILNACGGGVTFSGGEPLAQSEFLIECLQSLGAKVHRAIQTSGMCDENRFLDVLKDTDYVLFDLKLMDDQNHLRYTGASNQKILNNFKEICRSKIPFRIRMPLIPTITDTVENIESVALLMKKCSQDSIELLPYNAMTGGKYAMVGREYAPCFDSATPCDAHLDIFDRYGIRADIL